MSAAERVPVKEGLFALDGDAAVLLGGHCPGCGRWSFPAQTVCPYCGDDGCQVRRLGRIGVLQLCTTVTNRPPGYDGPLPFGFGVVELPEGIRVLSRILQPERLRPGDRVQCTLDVLNCIDGRDVVTYAFGHIE